METVNLNIIHSPLKSSEPWTAIQPNITSKFMLCQNCNSRPATFFCAECGLDQPMKFCYNCDLSAHEFSYKSTHKRIMISNNCAPVKSPKILKPIKLNSLDFSPASLGSLGSNLGYFLDSRIKKSFGSTKADTLGSAVNFILNDSLHDQENIKYFTSKFTQNSTSNSMNENIANLSIEKTELENTKSKHEIMLKIAEETCNSMEKEKIEIVNKIEQISLENTHYGKETWEKTIGKYRIEFNEKEKIINKMHLEIRELKAENQIVKSKISEINKNIEFLKVFFIILILGKIFSKL